MKTIRLDRALLTFALALGLTYALHAQVTLVNIGHATNSGAAEAIVVSSNFAYIANSVNGLQVYDVSNPALPVAIAQTNGTPSTTPRQIAISSNYAYVTTVAPNPGFNVYDVSKPSTPSNVFRTNYNLFGGVAINGTNLYIGGDGKLPVFNISNPTNPVLVTNPSVAANPVSLAIGSNFIVGAANNSLDAGFLSNGLYTADLQSTNSPTDAEGVAIAGLYAIVVHNVSPLLTSYLITTNSETLTGHVTYPATNAAGSGYSVAVSGNYCYLGSSTGLRVINISSPTNLIPVGQSATNYGGIPNGIVVSGPYAYVANGSDGLRVFEVLPNLSVSLSNGSLLFSWPATSPFALQQRPFTSTNWMTLTNVPVLVNGTNEVSLANPGTSMFYRLISM